MIKVELTQPRFREYNKPLNHEVYIETGDKDAYVEIAGRDPKFSLWFNHLRHWTNFNSLIRNLYDN